MTRLRFWMTIAVLATLVVAPLRASALAQDNSGDNSIETTRTSRNQDDPTPTSSDDTSVNANSDSGGRTVKPADITVDGIAQTIAQGLAAFDGMNSGMWRITEISPKNADSAPSVTVPWFGFLYQVDGTTIVRNDETGKRARLEPGEAYFFSAGDDYTRYREETASRAWLIEVVPTDAKESDAPGTVIYSTPPIGNFPSDTRDMELAGGNLANGADATVPNYEIDALLIITMGSLEVTTGEKTVTLDAPSAVPISDEVSITNSSGDAAVYAVAKIGNPVADFSGSAPADETDAGTPVDSSSDAEATVDPMQDTDGDSLIDTDEAVYGTDPNNPDTDGDGYDDYTEVVTYNTNPLDPNEWP